MDTSLRKEFIRFQKEEILGYQVFLKLSANEKNLLNRQILKDIACEENEHFLILEKYTHILPKPNPFKLWFYILTCNIFGITFGIKLMELQEQKTIEIYRYYSQTYSEMGQIVDQEEEHEQKLIAMIETKTLSFISAIVLGMNDALVELTGSLAGFTLALQNPMMIALLGSITGVAAAMSMAASEYLSVKAEKGAKTALRAATYTGISYIITVVLLVVPFLWIANPLLAMLLTLGIAIAVIAVFNFYYSVVKNECFKKRFAEMLLISFSVVIISFGMGYLLKKWSGIDM